MYSPLHGEYHTAGGIGRSGIGLRTRLLASSRARVALGDCILTVDDVARSSMIVAILCFTFCKIALPLRRALPSNEVSSGVRTALPALCPSQTAVVVPPPHLQRPSVEHRLLVSPSSWNSAQASCISTLATWRMKEVVSAVRSRRLPAPAVGAGRRSGERELGTLPAVLSLS